jgi:hypothetical protein
MGKFTKRLCTTAKAKAVKGWVCGFDKHHSAIGNECPLSESIPKPRGTSERLKEACGGTALDKVCGCGACTEYEVLRPPMFVRNPCHS